MRLRNVKNADMILKTSKYFVIEPESYKNKWRSLFGNDNPIHIEIGMGKGKFISEKALLNPNINFIGIEKYNSVMSKAVQRIKDSDLPNLKLICIDAHYLEDLFYNEIDTIYLNFSDPWPKERHSKRRLTSDIFMVIYDKLFNNTQRIIMKTDNLKLYEYSINQFKKYNYKVKKNCYNIDHKPPYNIMTEYEEKFLNNDETIYWIKASK